MTGRSSEVESRSGRPVAAGSIPAVLTICLLLSGCYEYSEGDRVGVVQKFSHKGIFNSTWEGEAAQEGFRAKSNSQGSASNTNVFVFTVEDPALVAQVQKAMNSGKPHKLTYVQEFWNGPTRTSQGLFGAYYLKGITPTGD